MSVSANSSPIMAMISMTQMGYLSCPLSKLLTMASRMAQRAVDSPSNTLRLSREEQQGRLQNSKGSKQISCKLRREYDIAYAKGILRLRQRSSISKPILDKNTGTYQYFPPSTPIRPFQYPLTTISTANTQLTVNQATSCAPLFSQAMLSVLVRRACEREKERVRANPTATGNTPLQQRILINRNSLGVFCLVCTDSIRVREMTPSSKTVAGIMRARTKYPLCCRKGHCYST